MYALVRELGRNICTPVSAIYNCTMYVLFAKTIQHPFLQGKDVRVLHMCDENLVGDLEVGKTTANRCLKVGGH